MRIVPLVAVAALVALGGVALASKGSSGSGGLSISGQDYFNSLSASQQQTTLARMYAWYTTTRTAGQWPGAVQDPALSNQNDLTDAGNFFMVVDAMQMVLGDPSGTAGTLSASLAGRLGAT